MKSMEGLWAQCVCLLLLGMLVNIECSGNHSVNGTVGNSNRDNITTDSNSTTTVPVAVPGITTTPLPSGNHTDNSSVPITTNPVTRAPPTRPPHNTTTDTDRSNTTRGVTAPGATTPAATTTTRGTTTHPATTKVVTTSSPAQGGSTVGYIFLVIIILAAILLVVFCCLKQNKTRRYSIDLRNKHEDAVIPLSTVEADAVFDAAPEKEMGTFSDPDASAASPETTALAAAPAGEPEPVKGEPVAGEKAVTDTKVSGSQEPLTVEQRPEKLEVVDLTEGEPTVSNKTSVESLEDQLNDNNSNNYCTRADGIVFKGRVYEILQRDPF